MTSRRREPANVLYLGTDYGIFVTIDAGKTWGTLSGGQTPFLQTGTSARLEMAPGTDSCQARETDSA